MEYKILVADDEKEIRNLLKLYLENDGFKVVEASTGLEVLDLLEEPMKKRGLLLNVGIAVVTFALLLVGTAL